MCNFRTNEIDLSEETDHEHSPPPEGERNCPLRSGARKPTGDSGESTGRGPSSGLIRLLLLLQRYPRGVRHSGQRVHHTPESITSAQSTQVLKRRMQHSPLRRAPAAALVSVLSLAASLLIGVGTNADAATPAAGSHAEKPSFEIAISSNDEVTTTFLGTAPPDAEQKLKKSCTEENFTVNGKKAPTVTFSTKDGIPTCTAVRTESVSDSSYVTHDGDEYVVDTSVVSGKTDHWTLSVVFPGKVTDAGEGRIGGDKKNKVSFDTFYNHKARGKDTAEADFGLGLWIIIILVLLAGVGGGVAALVISSNKKNRKRRYQDALMQQSFNTAAAPAHQQFPTTPPAQGVPLQQPYQPHPPGQGALPSTQASSSVHPGYPATPPPYQQGPDPMPPGTGGPSPQAGQNGYGRY